LYYATAGGTTLVSLDLRSNRTTSIHLGGALSGVALSADQHWLAYTTDTGQGVQSLLQRGGKSAVALRAAAYVMPQAFAPTSSALVFTAQDAGLPYVFTAPTTCPTRCTRRLGTGQQAVWGP
jgi:hypothetical protein